MISNTPKISIITVVYNGAKYLEETIQSVINQTYNNMEYMIIDGGSNNRTLNIIKKYKEILYHNKKGHPIKSFIKYKIKELLYGLRIYKGMVR